jgi:hypothetical protein
MLGYPKAAFADAHNAMKDAHEIGQAATLMYALANTSFTVILCGNSARANAEADQIIALGNEKGAVHWKARGMLTRGCFLP